MMMSDDREFAPCQDTRDDISISIVQFPVAPEPVEIITHLLIISSQTISLLQQAVNQNDNGKLFRVFRQKREGDRP